MSVRILTVEDDERIRTAVSLALQEEGWEVEETSNGEDAVASFSRQPSDVVLIDIMLPGIDGFEVCRKIRRLGDVPIVMVTARSDSHDVVAGLEAGADDYLRKPFDPKELSALQHVHRKGSLAMARSQTPGSGSAQFYIALKPLPELDGRYSVFGRVIKGMEVVDQINQGDSIIKASYLQSN